LFRTRLDVRVFKRSGLTIEPFSDDSVPHTVLQAMLNRFLHYALKVGLWVGRIGAEHDGMHYVKIAQRTSRLFAPEWVLGFTLCHIITSYFFRRQD
jgi:hypothetical protein